MLCRQVRNRTTLGPLGPLLTDWLAHQDLLLASYLTHKDEVAYKTFWSMHDRDQIAIFADYVSRNGEGDATAQALALVDAANAIEQDQLICLEITSWTLGDTRLTSTNPCRVCATSWYSIIGSKANAHHDMRTRTDR